MASSSLSGVEEIGADKSQGKISDRLADGKQLNGPGLELVCVLLSWFGRIFCSARFHGNIIETDISFALEDEKGEINFITVADLGELPLDFMPLPIRDECIVFKC